MEKPEDKSRAWLDPMIVSPRLGSMYPRHSATRWLAARSARWVTRSSSPSLESIS
jgi:hypothetical protein